MSTILYVYALHIIIIYYIHVKLRYHSGNILLGHIYASYITTGCSIIIATLIDLTGFEHSVHNVHHNVHCIYTNYNYISVTNEELYVHVQSMN